MAKRRIPERRGVNLLVIGIAAVLFLGAVSVAFNVICIKGDQEEAQAQAGEVQGDQDGLEPRA